MSEYNPTNTKAASCPSTGKDWEAVSSPLPPSVNADACSCMQATLGCIPSKSLDEDQYGDLFGTICGYQDGKYCAGINRNMTKGPYGAYGMCNTTEQLGWALNQYYIDNPNGGCDFEGAAVTTAAATTTASSCASLIKQAGAEGTGTVTSSPTGTAGGNGANGSKGAAAGLVIPSFSTGLFGLGIYVSAAALSGMALILL